MNELDILEDYFSPLSNKPINRELVNRVYNMRDTFATILDEHGTEIDGMLRIKMAKAELVLNRVAILMDQQLTDQNPSSLHPLALSWCCPCGTHQGTIPIVSRTGHHCFSNEPVPLVDFLRGSDTISTQ